MHPHPLYPPLVMGLASNRFDILLAAEGIMSYRQIISSRLYFRLNGTF